MRSWSFWKQKYGVCGFPQKTFRITDYKKDMDKRHHKLLHRFSLTLSRRQQWNESGNQWRECVLLYTPPASHFDPCDIWTGWKIWQYLFFSERGVASKLLLIPLPTLCFLDEHHVFRLNSQSSSFYCMLDQPEIGK